MLPPYTPGPWEVQWSDANGYWISHDPRKRDDMKTGMRVIATLNASPRGLDRADAQLIGAAPDMLELLGQLRVWLSTMPHLGGDTEEEKQAMLFDLNTVIAKAKGDQHA